MCAEHCRGRGGIRPCSNQTADIYLYVLNMQFKQLSCISITLKCWEVTFVFPKTWKSKKYYLYHLPTYDDK